MIATAGANNVSSTLDLDDSKTPNFQYLNDQFSDTNKSALLHPQPHQSIPIRERKMRSATPALRQVRYASSRLFNAESALYRTSQQPSILSSPASQCATVSTTASKRATPSSSSTTTRKFVPRSSSKPFTPTSSKAAPAPAARQQASSRESPSVMTVDDVDPTLSPLPSVSSSKSTNSSPSTSKGNFAESLQTPGYTSDGTDPSIDWSSSFHGLSTTAFEPHVASILMAPLDPEDIEIKPDGIAYLPEIKYRRILNQAFGPGGWGLAPRGELSVGDKVVTREYALVVGGRYVSLPSPCPLPPLPTLQLTPFKAS